MKLAEKQKRKPMPTPPKSGQRTRQRHFQNEFAKQINAVRSSLLKTAKQAVAKAEKRQQTQTSAKRKSDQ
ncbi:hypothetical protein PO124_10245 [Bacillus licheniformis]|nr:hypothetical protein [Bacillus licheniformis]